MSEFIKVRNKDTGAIASLPEASLPMFFNWEPAPGPPPEKAKPKKTLRRAEASGRDEAPDAEASGDTETTDAVSAASSEKEQS